MGAVVSCITHQHVTRLLFTKLVRPCTSFTLAPQAPQQADVKKTPATALSAAGGRRALLLEDPLLPGGHHRRRCSRHAAVNMLLQRVDRFACACV